MLGPLAKLTPQDLPYARNIHWLGQKSYQQLPAYLAGWDVALMPFAINEATRFISPTKTPEYLAGGKPVVSTSIRDVERHYGGLSGVHIATGAAGFVAACEAALKQAQSPDRRWRDEANATLSGLSWDSTHRRMATLLAQAKAGRARPVPADPFPAPGLRRGARCHDDTICSTEFSGSVPARQLAESADQRVLVVDKRDHIGGNPNDRRDASGICYGPHVFHTDSDAGVRHLSQFTGWRPHEHRVLACACGQRVPMQINRTSTNAVYGADLQDDAVAAAWLAAQNEPVANTVTARAEVVNAVGRELYHRIFEGCLRKKWGQDPADPDQAVIAGLSARASEDDRRFTDRFQAMPRHGYTRMFGRLLNHPGIDIALSTDFHELDPADRGSLTVYTGPIDAYFGYCYGRLPWRSLRLHHETNPQRRAQPVGVITFPDQDVPFIRVTEYKHLTGQAHPLTSVCYEHPATEGKRGYPVPGPENQALCRAYEALALTKPSIILAGLPGRYQDFTMDQVVGQAPALHDRLVAQLTRRLVLRAGE